MSKTGRRYKDVLFALNVSHEYGQQLGKLQLQKFIYLADVLSPLWNSLGNGEYQSYKHGPYDLSVQNAVDVLAFRGAVTVIESNFEQTDKTRVNYTISEIGLKIVAKIRLHSTFSKTYELYNTLGYYVDQRGWNKLKDMVYSEATYLSAKSDGYGRSLGLDSLLTNETLQILLEFNNLVSDGSTKLTKENLISIFFEIIDNYELLNTGVSQ